MTEFSREKYLARYQGFLDDFEKIMHAANTNITTDFTIVRQRLFALRYSFLLTEIIMYADSDALDQARGSEYEHSVRDGDEFSWP